MARTSGKDLENKLQARSEKTENVSITVRDLLQQDYYKRRFREILGEKAPGFMASIINATNLNPSLKTAEPSTVISSAAIAATLDLPIDPNLGFAAIVPFKDRSAGITRAQFMMMYRGFIQLSMRTGQYKTMNVTEVYEGEIDTYNPFTGEIAFSDEDNEFRATEDKSKIVGYLAYFKLINGFEKYFYMTKKQVEAHGKRYSKSFSSPSGRWQQDFDAMAKKTVIKMLLSKWGILSIQMQVAVKLDQATVKGIDDFDNVDYPDGGSDEGAIDAEYSISEDDVPGENREPDKGKEQEGSLFDKPQ